MGSPVSISHNYEWDLRWTQDINRGSKHKQAFESKVNKLLSKQSVFSAVFPSNFEVEISEDAPECLLNAYCILPYGKQPENFRASQKRASRKQVHPAEFRSCSSIESAETDRMRLKMTGNLNWKSNFVSRGCRRTPVLLECLVNTRKVLNQHCLLEFTVSSTRELLDLFSRIASYSGKFEISIYWRVCKERISIWRLSDGEHPTETIRWRLSNGFYPSTVSAVCAWRICMQKLYAVSVHIHPPNGQPDRKPINRLVPLLALRSFDSVLQSPFEGVYSTEPIPQAPVHYSNDYNH